DEGLRIRERQRLQEERVHYREDGATRGDAEGEREDRRKRHAGRAFQRTDGGEHIDASHARIQMHASDRGKERPVPCMGLSLRISRCRAASASRTARTGGERCYRPLFAKEGPVLFKKLFQVLVVGGAVASVQAGCATG